MNKKSDYHPLVSIIMNCYNGETYLYDSIKSVLSQSYENWELIFWDNRSQDKSAEIFKSYNDKRLKYYYAPKHTFLYEARNEAIKKTSGEYIAFLDTDDFWEKDKLKLQIPLFEDSEVNVVYGNFFIINEKLKTKRIFSKKEKPKGFILNNLLKNYCIGLLTIVIRKKIIDNFRSPFNNKFHIMGDFDLMIRLSEKYKFDCIEKPVATYRVHKKNESLLKKSKQIEELKIWYKDMISYPNIYNNKNFSNVGNLINNLEIVNLIFESHHDKARELIKKMPYSLKKIKYLLASILPYNFVKRFIEF